jgi:hypothetical protein
MAAPSIKAYSGSQSDKRSNSIFSRSVLLVVWRDQVGVDLNHEICDFNQEKWWFSGMLYNRGDVQNWCKIKISHLCPIWVCRKIVNLTPKQSQSNREIVLINQ